MTPERKYIYVLTLLAVLLFFYRLGEMDLWGDLVARNAWMARGMIQSGEWIVPHVNGHPDYEKPILWIWILALFSIPLGVNEFSVRLPCALAALGSVYAVYTLGRRLADPRYGFRAALIYMTGMKIMHMARVPRIDMSLTLFIALSYLFFLKGYQDEEKRRSSYLLSSVFASLGFLDKGPVGLVIPAGGIFFFLLLNRKLDHILSILSWRNIAAFLAVSAPWYIAVSVKTAGAFPREFFLYRNVVMYSSYSRSQPLWYYFPQLFTGFIPWSVVLPFAIAAAVKKRREAIALFPLTWFLWVFVFFSISVYKRGDYLLPLYPAASLLVALFWKTLDEERAGWSGVAARALVWLFVIIVAAGLVAVALTCVPGLAERFISSPFVFNYSNERDRDAMRVYAEILSRGSVFLLPVLAASALILARSLRRFNRAQGGAGGVIAVIVAVMAAVNTFYQSSIMSELDKKMSIRSYSNFLSKTIGPLERFALYDFWLYEFGYYMNRNVTELQVPQELRDYFARPEPGYCLVLRKYQHEATVIIKDLPYRIDPDLADPAGRFAMIVRSEKQLGRELETMQDPSQPSP